MKNPLKSITSIASAVAAVFLMAGTPQKAHAQDPLMGTIQTFGFNFCPRGWAGTDGQLLPISQYSALFSLLGTQYGGDGRTTFALPDLRGRIPIAAGAGPGLPVYSMGQRGGAATIALTVNEMPSHNHLVRANNGEVVFADRLGPGNDFLGSPSYNDPVNPAEDIFIYSDQDPNVTMDPRMIANTGGSQSFSIQNPYLGVKSCIALEGIYPSRS